MAIAKLPAHALVLRDTLTPVSASVAPEHWTERQVTNTLSYTLETLQALVNHVPVSEQERSNQCTLLRELLAFTLNDLLSLLPGTVQAQVQTILEASETIVHRAPGKVGRSRG